MWSTLKRSSAAKLGHDKRDISAFDTVLFHSNLSSLRRKFLRDVPTDKIVLSCGPKVSEKPLKRRYWWLKNKERKFHFRFLERRFLAAINFTGSAEGALVPGLLRITHWPKRTPRQNVCACVNFGYFRFVCDVRFRLILLSALRCSRLVAVNQQPQIKEKKDHKYKKVCRQ